MPLTRSTSRAAAVTATTKIPMPTNSRKRSIISPGPHKQCTKRSALGDITNQVILDEQNAQQKGGKVGPKKPPKPAFTIFEENIEPENKKAKKSDPKSASKRSKDLVVQNPVVALTRAQKAKSLEAEAKPAWRDIDGDTTDPMFAPEYAADIFENLRKRELDFLVEDYLKNQAEITETMRAILIDWLVEVQETFELFHETLYLAVRMVDRYLNRKNVRKLHLQLLGVTAIFLASKMEERYPPPLEDFIFVCDRAYTEDQILKMERVLCAELEYEVYMPLSYSFLRRFGKCVNADMRLLTIGRYALELSLQEYQYVTYRPSLLAAAALLFAMRKSGNTDWDVTCEHYSGYKEEDLNDLIGQMDKSTVGAATNKHCKTIYKKYSHRVFFEVALLPPLQ
ncbi:hypothetical protein ACHWQZ_G019115 [Mnemiopsis leidyi]